MVDLNDEERAAIERVAEWDQEDVSPLARVILYLDDTHTPQENESKQPNGEE